MTTLKHPLLLIDNVHRDYVLPRRTLLKPPPRVQAVRGVTLTVRTGESVGIVGESGCGKSTLARTVVALEPPCRGRIVIHGRDLSTLPATELRQMRRHFQMIFQDPYGSLDPRHKVARIVSEPYQTLIGRTGAAEMKDRLNDVLGDVGLKPADGDKFPHEFSGGQRQRIAIARALITKPDLVVADEAVSALDVSVQAQVLNLLMALREEYNLAYLFISHDLSVVAHVTDQVAVMYSGRIVEQGSTSAVFSNPAHPYTDRLLKAVPHPIPGKGHQRDARQEETAEAPDHGCPFAPRCPRSQPQCKDTEPELRDIGDNRQAACHVI